MVHLTRRGFFAGAAVGAGGGVAIRLRDGVRDRLGAYSCQLCAAAPQLARRS